MKNIHPSYLAKGEDEETYKKLAEQGMDLMHPVSIRGKTHRHDINIPYHATIKLFDTSKDTPEQAHEVAQHLNMTPPDPKDVRIEPTTIKGRNGNTMHVLKLHGKHADQIKEHHKKFSHLGYPEKYQFSPHITVDKQLYDHALHSKAKTAADLGIQFHPAELHHKEKVVASYKPKKAHEAGRDPQAEDKLKKSELLEKGALKNIGIAAAMGSALLSHQAHAPQPIQNPSSYSSDKMLRAISSIESSGGKNVNHAPVAGSMHHGERAYGSTGIMPQTIRETIGMNKDLKAKHGKAMNLKGDDLHHYMQDNPGLDTEIAKRHLKRLEHHFGGDPSKISYAWHNGISGTNKAIKEKKDIGSHWHVKKVHDAYAKEK